MTNNNCIHPAAEVHPNACLAPDVVVGCGTTIGPDVVVGAGSVIGNHCVIDGHTAIGPRCRIFTGAILGSIPQDLKYANEPTRLIIGADNVVREYVTINIGTGEKGCTVIGDRNLFMAYSHVAHDCRIGNDTVVANAGTFAGHVRVEDRAVIGGMTAIHQFVCVGKLAIVGGCSKVVKDIPPFAMVDGHPARVYGINAVGMQRAGISAASSRRIKQAFRVLFYSTQSLAAALAHIEAEAADDENIRYLTAFIRRSRRGICHGPR